MVRIALRILQVSNDFICCHLTLIRGTLERTHYLIYIMKIKKNTASYLD